MTPTDGQLLSELMATVRAGDVLVMRRPEPISQLIRWMDDSDRDHPVDVSHSMLVLSGGVNAEGFSVWPLTDGPTKVVSDVVIAPLRHLVRPYDRIIVLRHKELLRTRDDDPRVSGIVDRARRFYALGETGAIAFDDKQLYAKALSLISPSLTGARGRLVAEMLKYLDREIHAEGADRVICPELIMRVFNEGDGALSIRTTPVLPASKRRAKGFIDGESSTDEDVADIAWKSFVREMEVATCAIAVEILIRKPFPRPTIGTATSAQMLEYTTPGDLQRSEDLVVIGAWNAWTGRIDDVRSLPGGRDAVKQERLAGPGASTAESTDV